MKLIPLTQNQHAMVDDDDFDYLNQFKWYAHKKKTDNTFYARRCMYISSSLEKTITMHFDILKVKNADHIDGDGLNNQKSNLRKASYQQNNANRRKTKIVTSSAYKGVHWDKTKRKWRVAVRCNKELHRFGYFDDETEAAKTYDFYARKLFGEFAKTNFNDDTFSPTKRDPPKNGINKPIICINNNKIYTSFGEAARDLNIKRESISRCFQRSIFKTKGFSFRYATDEEKALLGDSRQFTLPADLAPND